MDTLFERNEGAVGQGSAQEAEKSVLRKGIPSCPPLSPEHLQRFRVAWLEEATPSMGVLGKRLLKKIVNHEEERALDFAAFTAQSSVTLEQIHR